MSADPKRVLLRIVLQQQGRVDHIDPAKEFRAHVRQAFSREQVTSAIKERLVEQRRRDALAAELLRLEGELAEAVDVKNTRARSLAAKIQELKKRV